LRAWLMQPGVLMLLVIGLGGFGLCYAYLRRAMHYLDPSASVPDRVRKALDTLNEGLLIVDQQARIVLANRAFREMHPSAGAELNGKRLQSLDWLSAAAAGATPPWEQTLASGEPVAAQALALPQPEGEATQLLVSSSAILDNRGQARGCLISFDNVTAVHRANEELRLAMVELEKSRGRIEQQNDDLRRLASRDSLTGCLNRRAFFELASAAYVRSLREQAPLCCLMVDIDHFKSFNDTYGHAVGDQVIQAVARSLSAGLRQIDLLARYGGEEFCVLLPGANEAQAMAVAERMRAEIEASASSAIRGTEVMPITASFGLTTLVQGARSIELMIDQADQALYLSKKSGRNRVTRWAPVAALA
jgi:diguanylate cyclase (GGDEF)-like protein/PAS domain S-box-containing protein